ncbi:MAG: hypothetical protein ACFWT6_17265 [Virgibacillus proomii]
MALPKTFKVINEAPKLFPFPTKRQNFICPLCMLHLFLY